MLLRFMTGKVSCNIENVILRVCKYSDKWKYSLFHLNSGYSPDTLLTTSAAKGAPHTVNLIQGTGSYNYATTEALTFSYDGNGRNPDFAT